jgi:hypothetical protein
MLKAKDLKLGKCYYFEWFDATSRSTWETKEEAFTWFKEDNCWISHCGWLMYKDKHTLGFCSRKSKFVSGLDTFGMLQKIPKTWIKNIKELKAVQSIEVNKK